MARSGSQKFLLVISVLNIIFAIIGMLGSVGLMLGGSLINLAPASEAANLAAETGMTTSEVGALFAVGGAFALFGSAIELIMGILGVRAANDNRKIMPVWVISLISLILSIIGIVIGLVNGQFSASAIGSYIGSLVGSGLMFWIANNIKRQAGL